MNVHGSCKRGTGGGGEANGLGQGRPLGFRDAAQASGDLGARGCPCAFHRAQDTAQFIAVNGELGLIGFGQGVTFGGEGFAARVECPGGIAHAVGVVFHLQGQRPDDFAGAAWADADTCGQVRLQGLHHALYAANDLDGVGGAPHHAGMEAEVHREVVVGLIRRQLREHFREAVGGLVLFESGDGGLDKLAIAAGGATELWIEQPGGKLDRHGGGAGVLGGLAAVHARHPIKRVAGKDYGRVHLGYRGPDLCLSFCQPSRHLFGDLRWRWQFRGRHGCWSLRLRRQSLR